MVINNKIDKNRIKNVLIYNWWAFALFILTLVLVSYITYSIANYVPSTEKMNIWIGGNDLIDEECIKQLKEDLSVMGIKEVNTFNYNPSSSDYVTNFSTLGYYNTDIYILPFEQLKDNTDYGIFAPLEQYGEFEGYNYYQANEIKYGIEYEKGYYIMVNPRMGKDVNIVKKTIDIILEYKFI